MATDDERRLVAERLRSLRAVGGGVTSINHGYLWSLLWAVSGDELSWSDRSDWFERFCSLLADLIEPSYKPDAKYEAWYNILSHYGDKRGGPSTIRELIEEIVWTALTVDLGPNGNTDPSTDIDEGGVYTNKLFAEWEREALRLSSGIDRDALLALAGELDRSLGWCEPDERGCVLVSVGRLREVARRVREACGEEVE